MGNRKRLKFAKNKNTTHIILFPSNPKKFNRKQVFILNCMHTGCVYKNGRYAGPKAAPSHTCMEHFRPHWTELKLKKDSNDCEPLAHSFRFFALWVSEQCLMSECQCWVRCSNGKNWSVGRLSLWLGIETYSGRRVIIIGTLLLSDPMLWALNSGRAVSHPMQTGKRASEQVLTCISVICLAYSSCIL